MSRYWADSSPTCTSIVLCYVGQINEAHLFAKMDFECRIRDAEFLAYPPVVAGTFVFVQYNLL